MDIYIISQGHRYSWPLHVHEWSAAATPICNGVLSIGGNSLVRVEISHGHKSVAILALMLINVTALSANNRDKSKWSKTFYKRCCTFK